ncbi:diguanylate cyclase domain-containing protein [Nocardioides kongjuensis]|uniref:Diguanylate cyclase (GGDEF)-like protein/PAS domain S-box-containing protein n=1 Tax=Nocardioides kongjuensis TaxID=349522 RepID=A0A852RRP2_9ACTN|nr:sensor domain-containing diguanylate cyclase [Nocardioides kongjuensis]NYD33389.1 diguanylate cyclase (GGDEF)-like protein/PAS domain S-box-containing protein [Nocardioides kongjuensis]
MHAVVRLASWTAAFVAAGYVGRATIIDGTALSLVWPAAGVALLWLATSSRRTVAADTVCFATATFVVNASTGASPALATVFVVANLVQAGLVLALARWWVPEVWGFGGRRPLGRLAELGRFVAAALIACLVAALVGSAGLYLTEHSGSLLTVLAWWGRNTVGLVAVSLVGLLAGPALVAAARSGGARSLAGVVRRAVTPRAPARAVEVVLLVMTTAGVYLAVFATPSGPALAFLVLVPTFWAGIRFSPLAATVHSLGCAAAAVELTLLGEGPFVAFDEVTARALVAQLCVLMTMVAGLSLAFSHAQERTVAAELTSLMDASRLVALVSTDLGGRVRTFGVGAERLLGYDASEVVGHRPLSRFVVATDLQAAADELGVPPAEVLAELARREGEPRTWTLVRKDGSRLFARLALSQLRDAGGTATGYLAVAIDVTEAVHDQQEREHLQQQLAHLAHHDPLTGLPNRRWFESLLREHLATTDPEQSSVLLMLDLDHFKQVNDTLGHAAGDALLRTTADVLRHRVRHTDAVARLGGDEFAVLLTDTDPVGAANAAQGLVDAVRAHTALLAPVCRRVSLSVGGVELVPGGDALDVLHRADAALYEAKRRGRDQQVVRAAPPMGDTG